MPLENVLRQIATIQKEIQGIRQTHANPPASLGNPPCFVNFVDGPAPVNYTPSRRETRHEIRMALYVTRKVLPQSQEEVIPFIDRTLDKFGQNLKLNDTCAYSLLWQYSPVGLIDYGRTAYIGTVFSLTAVEHESITFVA